MADSTPSVIVELIANSPSDCAEIERSGADRIELVSNLDLGGLTPTTACVSMSRVITSLPLCVMVRPRGGDFSYTDLEFQQLMMEAEQVVLAGADAVVTGFLTTEGRLDRERFRRVRNVIPDVPIVCHRCFDRTRDVRQSLEELIDLGVQRVLTSGATMSAVEGAGVLAELVERAAGRIEILVGGGVRAHNVVELLQATGASQVHASANKPVTAGPFGASLQVDPTIAREFVSAVR